MSGSWREWNQSFVTIAANEQVRKHHRATKDRHVGQVEGPEPHVADADVDEVDDPARTTEPVEQVARTRRPR